MALFEHAFGKHRVKLLDRHQQEQQAFNQADAYALQTLANTKAHATVTIINDEHGALAIALQDKTCLLINDYASYQHKVLHNWPDTKALPAINNSDAIRQSQHEAAIVKLPKNLAYFEYLLQQLSGHCDTVIVAGMQKYWPKAFYQCAYDYFENVEVLPGVKKAKCMVLSQGKQGLSTEPRCQKVSDQGLDINLVNYPGVFASEKLDIGSRFLLEHFPDLSHCNSVFDLGAGNGVLGLFGQRLYHYELLASDDFYLAKKSALTTAENFTDGSFKAYYHEHCLYQLQDIKVDAVLCNPPFHQGHSVSDHIAKTMFKQSADILNPGGSLYVVANKHLAYKPALKKHFNQVTISHSNDKFFIYKATKAL